MEFLRYVCVIFCLIGLFSYAEALNCYACFDTGQDNTCQKYSTYVDAWEGKQPNVLRNCTTNHNQICYIETYKSVQGQTISQIRDCNDIPGKYSFTYAAEKAAIYTRLTNSTNNNQTSCVWNFTYMVCLSKCDSDYCNGPLMKDVNGATVTRISWIVLFLTVTVVPVCHSF